MANSLNQDISNKMVIVGGRRFYCKGGFGAYPFTSGSAIFGEFENGEKARLDGHDVEALAPEEIELLERAKETKELVDKAIENNSDQVTGADPTCSPGSALI